MTRRTVLITGGSDGLGAVAAGRAAARGERVLIVGRDPGKTAAVAERTGAEPFVADFSELDQVRELAERIRSSVSHDGTGIDALANNAGGIFREESLTVDGNELTLQVNHLSPFLLTHLLHDELLAGGGATIVNTSSIAHRLWGDIALDDLDNVRGYSPEKAYGDAKLANALFARALHERFADRGIAAVAFHPGIVATGFAGDTTSVLRWLYGSPLAKPFLTTAQRGGETLDRFLSGRPDVDWRRGAYYSKRRLGRLLNPQLLDDRIMNGLWERSAERVGIAA